MADTERTSESTSRLEAFSDGVLAIVMTLLVLDLRTPAGRSEHLAHFLSQQWPTYVAYLSSFLVIGVIWLNHHAVIGLLDASDHGMRVLNLLLLAAVSVIPFPTALVAEYSTGAHTHADQLTAAVVYGSVMTVTCVLFNLLWRRILAHPELRRSDVSEETLATRHQRLSVGLVLYPVVTAFGLLDIRVFLAGILLLTVLYLLPTRDSR